MNVYINRRERCGTYLRKAWRLPENIDRVKNERRKDLSVNTVAEIAWRKDKI